MLRDVRAGKPVWALGAMSGTSLDGVDGALIQTDGARILAFGASAYREYSADERTVLRAALGQWEGLEDAARVVEAAHVAVLGGFAGADLVGFHGQTTAHDPGGRGTCQIGDGQRLADALNLPVVWDFRSADVTLGGQGAPLAPFFHHACARWAGLSEPAVFLNLGGVGNLTWVDPRIARPEEEGACLAFDTGPANAPLNDLMQKRVGQPYDADGAMAASGRADPAVLERFSGARYLAKMPPKSLDRNDFDWLEAAVEQVSVEDAAATLVACVALSVAEGLSLCPSAPSRLFVTGGGRNNPVMMREIAARVSCSVAPVEAIGLDGDMLEAQAFGYLAVRVARGWPTSAPSTTGVAAAIGGGILSQPDNAVADASS